MSPLYASGGKLLRKNNALVNQNNCCCAIGDGRGGVYLVSTGGDTCWGVDGNAHIFFSDCSSQNQIVINGLGIIGKNDVPSIEGNVTYNGNAIKLSNLKCPINEVVIRTSDMDCVNIIAQGSRNTGSALGWQHSPHAQPFNSEPCGGRTPGLVGGQGAYTLTVSNIDPNGDFLVYLKLGCNVAIANANPLFPLAPDGKNGTYFYVAGDNQNAGSTLNGNPVLVCGPDGRMIEKDIIPNFGNTANWYVPADCIVWLVEGWIVSV